MIVRTLCITGLLLQSLLWGTAFAQIQVPPSIQRLIVRDHGETAFARLQTVSVMPIDEFRNLTEFQILDFIGGGFGGRSFVDSEGTLYKLTNLTHRELMGALLWAMYFPEEAQFPTAVAADYSGYVTRFVKGTPLHEILTTPSLYDSYDHEELWRKIIELQNKEELVLFNAGVTIDINNPGNIIVSTNRSGKIQLTTIDREPIRPSQETFEYYAEQGILIPKLAYATEENLVAWPVMPDNIVMNRAWGLSYDQALTYLSVRYGLKDRAAAVAKLASTPRWPILIHRAQENFALIERAQAELCELGLKSL